MTVSLNLAIDSLLYHLTITFLINWDTSFIQISKIAQKIKPSNRY